MPEDQQIALKHTLENLVSGLEVGNVKGKFDPKTAYEIRKKAGLSQNQLANAINGDRISHFNKKISKYENGRETPTPNSEGGIKYLQWLKEQGYNPFNL